MEVAAVVIVRRLEWWWQRRVAERAERRRLVEQQARELAAAMRRAQASPRCNIAHPELRGVYCQEPAGHSDALHIDRRGGRAIAWQATGYEH